MSSETGLVKSLTAIRRSLQANEGSLLSRLSALTHRDHPDHRALNTASFPHPPHPNPAPQPQPHGPLTLRVLCLLVALCQATNPRRMQGCGATSSRRPTFGSTSSTTWPALSSAARSKTLSPSPPALLTASSTVLSREERRAAPGTDTDAGSRGARGRAGWAGTPRRP